jgi:hypothetical protein
MVVTQREKRENANENVRILVGTVTAQSVFPSPLFFKKKTRVAWGVR